MSKSVKTEVQEITPEVAIDIMHKNTKNRPLSEGTAQKYAAYMRKGEWQFNGEPIIIAKDGRLLDGQHRLRAVILSKTTQKMLVVTGIETSAFKTVDIGNKRTGADALATHSKEFLTNARFLAAAVNLLNQFDDDMIFHEQKRSVPQSHEDLIEFVEDHKKSLLRAIDFAWKLTGAKKFIPLSALAALYYLFSKKDADTAEVFFHKISTGENLSKGDPALLLRQRLINMKNNGGILRAREAIPYVLKAWEYTREGRKIERLKINDEYIPMVV